MTHIENIKLRQEKEYAIIHQNNKIYQVFRRQKRPISDIELSMMLDISAVLARRAIAQLERENLIIRDYKRNYRLNSHDEILGFARGLSDVAIARKTKLEIELVRFELNEMLKLGLVQTRQAKDQADYSKSQLVYEVANAGC